MFTRTFFQHKSDERGYLIILTMIIIFAMSSIAMSIASVVTSQYSSTQRNTYVENALAAAEAGVSATIQQLNMSSSFAGFADTNRQQLYNDATRGKASYSSTVTNNSDGTKTIISNGYTYRPGDTTAYNTKRVQIIVKNAGTSVAATVVAGSGGILVTQGTIKGKNIYVNGQVSVGTSDYIGSGGAFNPSPTDVNLNVANVGCGSGASYPQPCATPPISIGWNGGIYGTVCATGQTDSTNIYSGISGQGLISNCTAPVVTMPAYDRSGMYNTMLAANGTKPSSSIGSCNLFVSNLTINANTIYTGDMNVSGSGCTAAIKGNVYITGNLNVSTFANLRVDNALTTPPVILVDGNVNFNDAGVQTNSSGVGAIVISFKSSNASCDHTCTSLSASDLYSSVNTVTALCSDLFCSMYGSTLYSYFGTAEVAISGHVSGIGGQRIWANALSQLTTDEVDVSGIPGNDAFNGATKLPKWKLVDYQQLSP